MYGNRPASLGELSRVGDDTWVQRRLARILPAAGALTFFLLGLSVFAVEDSSLGDRILFGLFAPASAWVAVRCWRGGLVVRRDHVEIRNEFRTRRIEWCRIHRFEEGGNWSVIPWRRLYVVRNDGARIAVPYVANLPRLGAPIASTAEALNDELRRRVDGTPRAASPTT